jgi:hypothetical protein
MGYSRAAKYLPEDQVGHDSEATLPRSTTRVKVLLTKRLTALAVKPFAPYDQFWKTDGDDWVEPDGFHVIAVLSKRQKFNVDCHSPSVLTKLQESPAIQERDVKKIDPSCG